MFTAGSVVCWKCGVQSVQGGESIKRNVRSVQNNAQSAAHAAVEVRMRSGYQAWCFGLQFASVQRACRVHGVQCAVPFPSSSVLTSDVVKNYSG